LSDKIKFNMKKFGIIFGVFVFLSGCSPAQLQEALNTVQSQELTSSQIGNGLKEALNLGISVGADRLSAKDGYFKSAYKILLPAEARKVTEKLQVIPGFSNVEEILLEKINRGAEDAAMKAKPIFVNAIKQMTFEDALGILMGSNNAATQYLDRTTRTQLYSEFNPVIKTSLDKFNALGYWKDAVSAYNKIPFITKVNPSLDDYITQEALKGLFSMVEKEESDIRLNKLKRPTELLQKVFAKQDSNRN
jgi:hypothetical protein